MEILAHPRISVETRVASDTHLVHHEGSQIQQDTWISSVKALCEKLNTQRHIQKNENTSIYSGAKHLNSNPEHIDPNKLKTYRRHATLMTKQDYQTELLWQRLSHLKCISTTNDLELILADEENLAFRFYDTETHSVAQVICHSIHASRLKHAISSLDIKEIPHTGVYECIHS